MDLGMSFEIAFVPTQPAGDYGFPGSDVVFGSVTQLR